MLLRFWFWLLTRLYDDRRGLFGYHDGARYRTVDALVIARQLFAHVRFDWDDTPQMLQSGTATTQLVAFQLIGETVREVFGVPDVAHGGLTDLGCSDLLAAFREYLGDVKKNGSLFPILPASTESPFSVDLPIPPPLDSACGSTPIVRSPEPPGLPPEPIIAGSTN